MSQNDRDKWYFLYLICVSWQIYASTVATSPSWHILAGSCHSSMSLFSTLMPWICLILHILLDLWICGVKPVQRISSQSLCNKLGVPPQDVAVRARLRWFGHVKRSVDWINKCTVFEVPGKCGKGRPRKSWEETLKEDLKAWNLEEHMAYDRANWRNIWERKRQSSV